MQTNNEQILPPDYQVRLEAINPTKSFAVAAPAGSGKTGLLTQRVLQLLAGCEQPEEVLAITFTRKAAGEMQDRIINALWQAAEQPEPSDAHAKRTWDLAQAVLERDAALGWHLLQSPQRLRVTTIDSLCRSITQQLPLASGIGAQPDTLENPDLAYRLAVRELFKQLDKEGELREHLARLLRHVDNNLQAVENLLAGLLAKREQWLMPLLMARHQQARPYFEQVIRETISDHLQQVAQALLLHGSELCTIADSAATHLQAEGERKNRIHNLQGIVGLPDTEPSAINDWLALADLLLTNSGTYRARPTKAEGFPAGKENASLKERFAQLVGSLRETQPDAEQLIAAIRELPPARYDDSQWQLLESLTQILPQLVAELTLVFKQLAATDYTAITQAALLALGDEDAPSDLALQLDYRIRHILVDEFQDTASPQLQLLQKLTAGWQNDDGRTLFIVGDGMQSCYGFRNANVGLFLDARQQGIGNVELDAQDLCVNFRSQSGVVDWVNQIFKHAFPAQDDISRGAVKYSESSAFKPALEGDAVQVHIASYSTDNSDEDDSAIGDRVDAQKREAQKVVALINDAQQQNPEGSIAILVRTRSHLQWVLPALTAAGLKFQATEIDRLASRMAIMDLRSLTRALLNPQDRIAWLSILRAPWCGLSLADLHQLVHFDLGSQSPRLANGLPLIWTQVRHYTQIPNLSAPATSALARVLPVLEQAWQARARKPLRQWLEGVWQALGGPACLLDKDDVENIQSYLALLDKHQQAGQIPDWSAFDQAMEQLFAAPRADADPRLQVMTIHKSKGLEFDTVIIPGLDRGKRSDEKELLLWQERISHSGERQLLLGSFAPVGKEDDQLYTFMRGEATKQQLFEATRLLYVGCTRAIQRLHLLACVQYKEESYKAPAKQSLLACIWAQIQDQLRPINQDSRLNTGSDHSHQAIARLRQDWRRPEAEFHPLLQAYRGREFSADMQENPRNLPDAETSRNRLARHTGTLIHSALETLVIGEFIAQEKSLSEFIAAQQPLWQLRLKQWGWNKQESAQALDKINQALHHTLADERGRWLLDSRHQDSQCELALVQSHSQGVSQSIIDRTFVDGNIRWIIDYKSSEPEADESLVEFSAREINTYAPQLARYKELMGQLDQRLIRAALYFTTMGHFYEWD